MKPITYFYLSLFLFCPAILTAQLVGRGSSSQDPGKEIKAQDISTGSLSGDVNLFTGTYNMSYPVGTVSTLSGLSFTANLNYSSTFSSGDNQPHLSGVPYGEGWQLDIPTISINTEDYNKYTLAQMENFSQSNPPGTPKTPTFTNPNCDPAKEEGRLYWYAPTINIPGIASGRTVYKKKDGNEYVFVLNRFERYIEARLDLSTLRWRVIIDDGTEYQFYYLSISHRNPVNQRIQQVCQNVDNLKQLIAPKSEITTWYCEFIRHPNHVDTIKFSYRTFGTFDQFKLFTTSAGWKQTLQDYLGIYLHTNFLSKTVKDVFLSKIYTTRDSLVFNYGTIATTGGANLPDGTFTNFDDLYATKTAKIYDASSKFTGWRRYHHIRSDNLSTSCNRAGDLPFEDPLNPYLAAGFPGGYTVNHGYLAYKDFSGTPTSLYFDHGYLESPKIPFSNFISGETYELKVEIDNYSSDIDCLFDLNVATGDDQVIFPFNAVTTYQTNYMLFNDCWKKKAGESIFTTFNQGVKWGVGYGYSATGEQAISNFFQMPNLPNTHNGFYIQLGPANSDTKFNKTPDEIGNLILPYTPDTYATYLQANISQEENDDNLPNPNSIIRSGGSIPNNFGIGAPWFMLQNENAGNSYKSFYDGFGDANDPKRWWNDKKLKDGNDIANCTPVYYWANRPSRGTESTELEKVELIRYAKKPYMLQNVVYKVKNAAQTFVAAQKLEFGYTINQLSTFAAGFLNAPNYSSDKDLVNNTGRNRNIVLLGSISQKAADGSSLPAAQTPVTKFTYKKIDLVPANFGVGAWRSDLFPINANCYALEQVTDPLGNKTVLEYYPMPRQTDLTTFSTINVKQPDSLSYMVTSYRYRPRPAELKANPNYSDCNSCTYPSGHPAYGQPAWNLQMGRNQAYQVYLVVKHKKVTDRDNIEKIWKYQPDSIVYNFMDRPVFGDHFVYDFTNNSIQAGFKKMVVTGPNPTTVGGPVNTYRHHTGNVLWGKLYYADEKTAGGATVSVKRLNYQYLLAFNKPWSTQNPVSHPDFSPVTAPQMGQTRYITLDMPYFYETRYATNIDSYKPDYLKSYFVKLCKDSTVTYHQGGNNLTITEYEYFDADNLLSTTSAGYQAILGGSLPITLSFEPSWQLYRTKSWSTEYTGANALYTQQEHFYLYDLANKSSYQSAGAVNPAFKNLWFVWKKNMRNAAFETRKTTKTSFSDGPKIVSTNTVYKKFFETGGDPLSGYLLPSAIWQQADSTASQTVTIFQSANGFKEKVNWRYVRTDTFNTYSSVNLAPTLKESVFGMKVSSAYNAYTGLPTTQIVGFTLSDALTTTYTYNSDNTLASESQPNNLVISYTYDKLKRPTTVSRNNQILKRYVYSQANNVSTATNFQTRTNNNYLRETQFTTSTDTFLTFTYRDPLGRPAAVIRDGYVLGNNIYDVWSRVIYQLKPAAGSTPATSIPASPSTHLQFQSETAPRSRIVRSAKYGEAIATGHVVQNRYTIILADSLNTLLTQAGLTGVTITGTKFFNETVLDEDNKIMRVITNLFGQKVAEISGSGAAATVYFYNNSGVPNKVINPKNQATKLFYNYPGLLYKKETVDDGTTWYAYNQAGQLIADRNTLSEARIFKFDTYGRATQQTFIPASVNSDALFTDRGLPWIADPTLSNYANLTANANARIEKKWFYNGYDGGSFSLFTTTVQNFLNADNQFNCHGRVAQTVSYNLAGVPTQIQLLSYTPEGFVDWETQQFNQTGITTSSKGYVHFIDYPSYNRAGSLLTQNVDLNFDNVLDLQYTYVYDKRNRLKDLYVSYTNAGTGGRKVASYEYDNATDLLLRKIFYDRLPDGTCARAVDTVNYAYDARYRLTSMTSKTLEFNLAFDANQTANSSGQTLSTNYNGNINGIYAKYKLGFAGSVPSFTDGTVYTYTYDALNRLTVADAKIGVNALFANMTTNQKLFGDNTFSFDKIGNFNITSIWLFNAGNQAVETKWQYNYTSGKNTISTIQDITGSPFTDRAMSHDLTGRLGGDTKKSLFYATYRPSNLTWTQYFNTTPTSKTVNFLYGVNDQRLYKELLNGTTAALKEYYLHTVHGREIAILDLLQGTPAVTSWYVHGIEREARFPNQRYNTTTSGLNDGGGGNKYAGAIKVSDALELKYPARLYLVSATDTIRPLGYLLDEEVEGSAGQFARLREVIVRYPDQALFCTDTQGGEARTVTLQQVLNMRAAGEGFYLEGFSTDCITEEWAMLPPQTEISPRYYIYDHLGNVRTMYYCTIPTGCDATVYNLEFVADYSPYGRLLRSWIAAGASERYLTTQHERDAETGYDNRGARLYDSDLGRFLTLDPLAHKYLSWSAYNYVLGNPVIFIDPNGKSVTSTHIDADGKVLAVYNDGDLGVYVHNEESKSHWSDDNFLPKSEYGVYLLGQTSKWDEHFNNIGGDYFGKLKETGEAEPTNDSRYNSGPSAVAEFGLAVVDFGAELGEKGISAGGSFRVSNNRGSNFSPKYYASGWTGGSAGKIQTYNVAKTGFRFVGWGIGAYNAYQLRDQLMSGEISGRRHSIEQASNFISTFGGIFGAFWGIGWEGGRLITQLPGYHENFRIPVQRFFNLIE